MPLDLLAGFNLVTVSHCVLGQLFSPALTTKPRKTTLLAASPRASETHALN